MPHQTPIPSDLFAPLKLSNNPVFQQADPEVAALYVRLFRKRFTSPEIKKLLARKGIPASSIEQIFDVPFTAEAIEATRKRARGTREGIAGIGNRISEGMASTVNFFGLDDPLLAAIGAGGAEIDPSAFTPLPEESVNLPVLGDVDPIALGAQLATFLVPAALAVRAGGAVVGAAGLSAAAPRTAAAAAFALGGGGLEATRQSIRAITKDEEFDPAQIGIEAAIFGAGGAPLRGSFLTRRLRAGAASGTVASGLPPLLGREVDEGRIASEIAFGALFGNPKVKNLTAGNILPRIPRQKSPEAAIARQQESAARELQRAQELVKTRGRDSKEAFKRLQKAQQNAADFGVAQEFRNAAQEVASPEAEALHLHDPEHIISALRAEGQQQPTIQAQALRDRAAIIEEIAKTTDKEVLERLITESSLSKSERGVFRDALAQKEGRTVIALDAATETTPLPAKDFSAQLHPEADAIVGQLAAREVNKDIFQAGRGDPLKAADSTGFKALTRKTDPLPSKLAKQLLKTMTEEQRLRLGIAIDDAAEAILRQRRQAGKLEGLDENSLMKMAADQINLRLEKGSGLQFDTAPRTAGAERQALRQMFIDANLQEQHLVKKQQAIARSEGTPEVQARLEEQAAELQAEAKQIAETPPEQAIEATSFIQARQMLDELTDGMTEKQMRDFKLPAELEPFRPMLEVEVRRKIKHRKSVAKATDSVRKLRDAINTDPDVPVSISVRGGQGGLTRAVKTGRGLSFNDLRDAFRKDHSAELKAGPEGFELIHQGQTHTFPSLKAAKEALDDIKRLADFEPAPRIEGEAPTPEVIAPKIKKQNQVKPVLDVIATRKGVTIEHTGNGKWRTVNKTTGETLIHANMASVSDYLGTVKAPVSVELIPIPDNMVTSGGGGSIGGPGASGRVPFFEMPTAAEQSFPSTARVFGTQGELMKKIQDNLEPVSGLRPWDEVWEPMMRESNLKDKFNVEANRSLNAVFKGVKPSRRRIVQDVLIAGKEDVRVAEEVGAKPKELAAVTRLRKWYKDMMGLNEKQLDEFLEEVIPKFREEGGDPLRARQKDNTFPGSIAEILDDVIEGRIDLADPNAHVVAQEIMYSLGRQRFMKTSTKMARNFQKQLTKRMSSEDLPKDELNNLRATASIVGDFMDSMINGIHGGQRGMATARRLKPMFDSLKKMGLIERNAPTAKEVNQWAAEISSYVSGVALTARPALAIRNVMQRALAANKVGWDSLLDAQRMALTPEGLKLIDESGVIPGRVTWFVEDMAAMFKTDAEFRQFVQRAQAAGLYLYRKADHGNRGVSFLAGYNSFKEHASLLRAGNIDEFLFKTGLATESNTVLSRILKPLQDVDPKGWDAAVEKSAKEYGIRLAEDTQFIYNAANAPKWMQSTFGRFAGQFGLWPVAFTEYMLRNALPATEGLRGVRGQAAGMFIARQVAFTGILSAMGAATGIDMSSYNRANPLSYDGGPAMNALGDAITLSTGSEGEFGTRLAMRNLTRFGQTFYLPFGGVAQDILQAADTDNPTEFMLTILGFTLQEPGLFQ